MTQLDQVDVDVLLAKGSPRPLFVVIRPEMATLTLEVCEVIRSQWQSLIDANPAANLPPCVVFPKGWDIEAVYPPTPPGEQAE